MSSVELHQALHGYSGGHRLLAASQRLPREAERALLILSDISGPVTAGAFDSYLSGYAVPGVRAYALSRTWPAPEFSRPGCVWSHTLLIDHADLERISNPRVVLPYLVRPRKGESWQAYGGRLTLPLCPSGDPPAPRPWSETDAGRVLAALYGAAADAPTLLAAERSEVLEDLVLAVWAQQWPRLRRAFRFCTWSLAPRSIDGQAFDLQVVPLEVGRQLPRTQAPALTVTGSARVGGGLGPAEVSSWARAAAADLAGAAGPLRRFLWRFGEELAAVRPAFAALAEVAGEVALARQGHLPLAELVESITARWRLPGDAKPLKAALFGEGTARDPELLPSSLRDVDLLGELATTRHHAALDRDGLGLRRRGATLWRVEPGPALDLARRIVQAGPPSPLGEEVLRGIAEAMTPGDAGAIRERNDALFTELVRRNPSLAGPPSAPPAPASAPRRTPASPAPAATRIHPVPIVDRELPRPRAEARTAPAAPPPAAPLPGDSPPPGDPVVAGILDRLDRWAGPREASLPSADERTLLEARAAGVADWLARAEAPAPRTVVVVASVLDPHSAIVHQIGAEPWVRATAGIEGKLDRPTWIRLAAFLLALAFDNPGPRAEEIVATVFEAVDRAAASRELPVEAWRLLVKRLPSVPRWREADWSDRLRRGLVERFVQDRWPAEPLLRAARDDAAFQRVVMIGEWSDEGLALLKRLAGQVSGGGVEATKLQRTLLARYV